MKFNVAGDNHSITAWEFKLQAPNGRCANVTAGAVGCLLLLPPVPTPEGRFSANKKIHERGSCLGGSMNSFRYCGSEHNLEPTGGPDGVQPSLQNCFANG
jgi:hypothetical protein